VVVQFVEALCYKLGSHGFDSLPNPLGCSIPGVNSDCNGNKYQELFIYIPTNCTKLSFFYKQHIKTFVLLKF